VEQVVVEEEIEQHQVYLCLLVLVQTIAEVVVVVKPVVAALASSFFVTQKLQA
jgi:hypothetical protein